MPGYVIFHQNCPFASGDLSLI